MEKIGEFQREGGSEEVGGERLTGEVICIYALLTDTIEWSRPGNGG